MTEQIVQKFRHVQVEELTREVPVPLIQELILGIIAKFLGLEQVSIQEIPEVLVSVIPFFASVLTSELTLAVGSEVDRAHHDGYGGRDTNTGHPCRARCRHDLKRHRENLVSHVVQ